MYMVKYRVRNFNAESESIVKQIGGRVFALLETKGVKTALVEVPPGRGFVYLHKELLAAQELQELHKDTLVLK